MADIDFLRTYRGSFRGAEFLITSANTENGRKSVVHEFINTDRRFVEDLGGRLDTFQIECSTTRGRLFGGDYARNRDALIRALKFGGPGLLVHPFYGSRLVNVINYTVTESMNEFGDARFSIFFEESKPNIFPTNSGSNLSRIFQRANDLYNSISDNIDNVYRIRNISSRTLLASAAKIRSFGQTFQGIFDKYTSPNPNDFFRDINNFNDNVVALAQNPSELGDAMVGLFNSANDFASDADDAFSLGVDTFDFGDGDVPIQGITADLQDRINNTTLINEMTQTGGLVQAYRSAALIQYQTEQQVEETVQLLEQQFEKFESFTLVEQTIFEQMNDLRNQYRVLLDAGNLNLSKIITIETPVIPMTVLAYNYYGDTDRVDSLLQLNPQQDPSFVEGEVDIFSQ